MKSLEFLAKKKSFDPDRYGWPLHRPIYRKVLKGMVGIEVELEGRSFDTVPFSLDGNSWVMHQDGSLRNGMEYVLSAPVPFKDVPAFAQGLFDGLRNNGTRLTDSNRTSLHVHVNVQGMKPSQLCSFISLWGILEDVLVEFCGEYRVGNLFTLRLSDSEWAVQEIASMFRRGDDNRFTNDVRYLAMNVSALNKFGGSLEFRPYRGVSDAQEIIDWVEVIRRVYEASLSYSLPTDIPVEMSGMGPRGFFERVFGNMADRLWTEDAEDKIWCGIRRMQAVIYSLPWDELRELVDMKAIENPFGSTPKKRKTPLQEMGEVIRRAEAVVPIRFNVPRGVDGIQPVWMDANGN